MFRQQLVEACANLLAAKLRSMLAVLGVLVGAASVVAMVSAGQLATNMALKEFKLLGTNLLAVSIHQSTGLYAQQEHLSQAEVLDIATSVSQVKAIAPYSFSYLPISFVGRKLSASVIGVTELIQSLAHIEMQSGRFISDLDHLQYFCVIGNKLYQDLLLTYLQNPIGQTIQIGDKLFTIVGVMAPWQQNAFINQDVNRNIFIPLDTAHAINRYAVISELLIRLQHADQSTEAQFHLEQKLKKKLPHANLFFRSAEQLLARMKTQSRILTLLLGLIGGISLFVGGIGVMNVMLVTVTERRREIGIRRAVGATAWQIQQLFLIESTLLALLGGVLGIVLGVTVSYVITRFTGWDFTIYVTPIIIGFLVATATGVFFGYYPARVAARLNPIACLRDVE